MTRRSALRRLGTLALGTVAASLPLAHRGTQAALTTTRDALGWIVVLGQRAEPVIRISPRFALAHPTETLSLVTTGRLP